MLFATLALSGCQAIQIPNVRPCVEIPFIDAPEGACIWTTSHREELVTAEDWAKERPFQIILRSSDWAKIKVAWLQACRMAGPDCTTQVESIATLVERLDGIAGRVLNAP